MSERDPIRCPGAPEKWIERRDASGVPRTLTSRCECGGIFGYGIDHDCDWTAHDPDECSCDVCHKFRNCQCGTCEACGGEGTIPIMRPYREDDVLEYDWCDACGGEGRVKP